MIRNNYRSRNLIGHYPFWVISPRNSTSFTRPFLAGRRARAGHATTRPLQQYRSSYQKVHLIGQLARPRNYVYGINSADSASQQTVQTVQTLQALQTLQTLQTLNSANSANRAYSFNSANSANRANKLCKLYITKLNLQHGNTYISCMHVLSIS